MGIHMAGSLYKKVGIASLIMMVSVFLSRAIGLFREMAIAYVAGAGGAVDAYQIAFVIPEILNHLVASGFLSVTFIPIFSGYLVENREEEGWRVFSVVLTCFGSLLIVFIILSMIFAPELVSMVAPGIDDPVLKSRAVRMTRIILPAQFFFFVGGLFMAVQFAKERFARPALAPLFYNLGIIGGGILLGPRLGMEGFSWGVLIGAFVGNFALQYRGAVKAGMNFSLAFDFRHPDLRKYILLTLPLMLGLTMVFSTEFFLKFFGSYLPRGSIAGLNYGMRVMLVMVAFFGQAVGMASFPFMARLAAEKNMLEMNRLLNTTLKYLSLVIPFSMLMIVLRHEVIIILFQRGRFDAAATALTARVLVFLMVGAFAFAAQTVVVRGFYAVQNTVLPALFGTLAVVLSIPLYIQGMRVMGASGVALAISLSAFLQVLILFVIWNRHSRNPESRGVYLAFAKMFLFSLPVGLVLHRLRNALAAGIDGSTLWGSFMIAGLTGLVFLAILVAGGYVLNIEEVKLGLNRMVQRVAICFGR